MRSYLLCAALGALAGAMLRFPAQAAQAAGGAMGLWATAVAPTLFPFLLCMLLLSSRLRVTGVMLAPMGWLCGSPGGARLILSAGLRGRGALAMGAASGTMSPMFFLGTLGLWLNDAGAAAMLLFCHLLSALLTGLIFGVGRGGKTTPSPLGFADALDQAIRAMLTVAGCMALGAVTAAMAGCALPLPAPALTVIQCALEITTGSRALIAVKSPLTLPLLCGACSFGGLSLLMQNYAFLGRAGVKAGALALTRLVHGLLAFGLCYLCKLLFP